MTYADAAPSGNSAVAPMPAAPGADAGLAFRYPVMLDLTGRRVVIVGGGAVAARKAAGVLAGGAAQVRCVAPEFRAGFPDAVEKIGQAFEARHLEGATLVFAATDSADVNDAVVRHARALGILVSRADASELEPGDFISPAVLRRSAVTVAVSAGSAALSALVRDGLAERWDGRWTQMAEAMQQLRPALVQLNHLGPGRRAEIFRGLVSEPAFAALASGGRAALLQWAVEQYPEIGDLGGDLGNGDQAGQAADGAIARAGAS